MDQRVWRQLKNRPIMLDASAYGACAANGTNIPILGRCNIPVTLGEVDLTQEFLVVSSINKEIILGRNFQQENEIQIHWKRTGTCSIKIPRPSGELCEISELEGIPQTAFESFREVKIPGRTMGIITVRQTSVMAKIDPLVDLQPHGQFLEKYPNLVLYPLLQEIPPEDYQGKLQVIIINLDKNEIRIPKGFKVAKQETQQEVQEILDELNQVREEMDSTKHEQDQNSSEKGIMPLSEQLREEPPGKKFLTSPADVSLHKRCKLQPAQLTTNQKQRVDEMLARCKESFSTQSSDIGKTDLIQMDIDTGDSPPVCQKPYTLALKHKEWVEQEVRMLEEIGVVKKSISKWASPIVVVFKKSAPGEPARRRLCVDYRALNELSPKVQKLDSNAKGVLSLVPLPKIDEMIASLNGSMYFTSLDVRSGYHNIVLTPEAQPKTAFVAPFGKYEFTRVPFGLSQAPAYFQRMINEVIEGCGRYAQAYLDDVLIYSRDFETHMEHVEEILQRFKANGLKIKKDKCEFFRQELEYLGHILTGKGIRPVPEKLVAIQNMPAPTTVKEVQCFMGLMNYYRKFVPHYSSFARPILELVKDDVEFEWTPLREQCFQTLKEYLCRGPVLVYPDPEKPYILYTDASKYGWGGVLLQEYEHPEIKTTSKKQKIKTVLHPVAFVSGGFRGSQLNWAAMTKEAFGVYISVRKLSFFLQESDVTIRTDHKPLRKFLNRQTQNSKVNNWGVELQSFRLKLEIVEGKQNVLADALSRLVRISPESELETEKEGYEFGHYVFEPLPDDMITLGSVKKLHDQMILPEVSGTKAEINAISEPLRRSERIKTRNFLHQAKMEINKPTEQRKQIKPPVIENNDHKTRKMIVTGNSNTHPIDLSGQSKHRGNWDHSKKIRGHVRHSRKELTSRHKSTKDRNNSDEMSRKPLNSIKKEHSGQDTSVERQINESSPEGILPHYIKAEPISENEIPADVKETLRLVSAGPSGPHKQVQHETLEKLTQHPDKFRTLQLKDEFCQIHLADPKPPYLVEDGMLFRNIVEGVQRHEAIVVPQALIPDILKAVHNDLGHNGFSRCYLLLRRLFYWKGMRSELLKHIQECKVCIQQNRQHVRYRKINFQTPNLPMQFISMDLVGPFPETSRGNKYALTAIDMLTGFSFAIPIQDKTKEAVLNAYLHRIAAWFGPSMRILTDNGTEFKNAMFTHLAKELGVKRSYSPPYHPQSNGRIETFHYFLKACTSKFITQKLEWDQVLQLACFSYNCFPHEFTKESPFFLMFGRDPLLPLNTFLQPRLRYYGDDEGILNLEVMQNIFAIATFRLDAARAKRFKSQNEHLFNKEPKIKPNGLVMIKDVAKGKGFAPRYSIPCRVIKLIGDTKVQVRRQDGKIKEYFITHVKPVSAEEVLLQQKPKVEEFGRWRPGKYAFHPHQAVKALGIKAESASTRATS